MFNRKIGANGTQTFIVIWAGQLVSLVGTAMTRFALLIWAYAQTGDATTLALLGFFSFAPYILLSPIAGVYVDRWDRRRVMLFADVGAGMMTAALLVLYTTGGLQIWHLYAAEALAGAFEAFQIPAHSAATTLLVPRQHYARASGMRSLGLSASRVLAPFFAGFLLTVVGVNGVMLIDVSTFLVAVFTLVIVRVPRPPATAEGLAARGNVWQEMRFGFRYIFARPGLLGLLLIFVGIHLFAALTYLSILPAMILARTGNDEMALATVQSVLGIGGIVGGVWVSVWGGPKRKINGVLAGAALSFLLGDFLFATGQTLPVWIAAAFATAVFIPFITAGDRAIWQAKTPPDVQGRVFSVQEMVKDSTLPVGYLLAGPLADRLFEPAMLPGGALAGTFGGLVGTGPGAGMALMFVCTAVGGVVVSLCGYLIPAVRHVEDDLPDQVLSPAAAAGD